MFYTKVNAKQTLISLWFIISSFTNGFIVWNTIHQIENLSKNINSNTKTNSYVIFESILMSKPHMEQIETKDQRKLVIIRKLPGITLDPDYSILKKVY